MKMQFFSSFSLVNQEIFETGQCSKVESVLSLKSIVISTKNKKMLGEEGLLSKICLLQFIFYNKAFILTGFKKNQILKNFPIGGFLTIRKYIRGFSEFFLNGTLIEKNWQMSSIYYPFFFKFMFKNAQKLFTHFFRYSLYLF